MVWSADSSIGLAAINDVEPQGPQVAERKFDDGSDQEDQRPEITEQRKPRLSPYEIVWSLKFLLHLPLRQIEQIVNLFQIIERFMHPAAAPIKIAARFRH